MKTRKNPFCVIAKNGVGGCHDLQTNSAWATNPYGELYAIVPDDMVPEILETCGFCDIELNEDGTELVSFLAKEIPESSETPETKAESEEDITLDLLADHEYRLCMLELNA